MKNNNRIAKIIRWIARIWGSISLAFLVFMVGAHLIATITGKGEPIGKFNSISEIASFFFFPLCTLIGLAIAWKWEGLGGLITIGGIICFHMIRPDLLFDLMINGLAAPGLLYLLYWLFTRTSIKKQKIL
jgi:hypothetical protein